ncbi:hypothetical protein Trco_003056 [Trichoderma cornu-damae]|uniref:ORP1 like protein n=1 Tax=Trichoderma cornu-damae TaxID=654480 RepID=A0A9P8QNW9_9HYPO|nr:hypothetical protein Trco_003056 [Trichoderma cornu-damae]
MDKSMLKSLSTPAEEPEPAITTTHRDFDPERRILSHLAGRSRHANEAVRRLPACEAGLQTQDQFPYLSSDVAPLTQLGRDKAREASREALTTAPAAALEEEPRCMFVDDCQTGSQLRKAISHLFGRNKACTLRIPKQVWVYYCRKHYQRIRYRNAKTYPLNQMHLVKMQIRRLQRWSEENRRQGVGPYIKLWTLTLRKREQNRLDKEAGAADEGDDDSAEAQQSGSAAPEWIIERLGTGYTTEQILEVAGRLHREIENGTLSQVPEVEFLPDITESEVRNTARLVKSRKQAGTAITVGDIKGSKRKISEAADPVDEGSSSLPNQHNTDESWGPSRKRVRPGPPQADSHQSPYQMPLPSIAMSAYANNRTLLPSVGFQSAVPRTLPVVPAMQISPADHSERSDTHTHMQWPSPSEAQRHSPLDGFHSHDPQQYSAHYHLGADSAQPLPFQRGGGYHNYRRLPSISIHLAGGSDFHNRNLATPPHRASGAFSDSPRVPRPHHLRSCSANIPAAQPSLDNPRPAGSSGAAETGLASFDNRFVGSSTHELSTHGYPREHWNEPGHGYATGWPQGLAPQQQNYYAFYDQATRPQIDSLRAPTYFGASPGPAPTYLGPAPTYLDPTTLRATSEMTEHEGHRFANLRPHTDQVVTRVTEKARED